MNRVEALIGLAYQIERLSEPSRELDFEILFATFPKERVATFDGIKHISTMTGRDGEPWFNPLANRRDCPYYTRSLDAAVKLLPEGWFWGDLNQQPVSAKVWTEGNCAYRVPRLHDDPRPATAVLALVVAALRAHAHVAAEAL